MTGLLPAIAPPRRRRILYVSALAAYATTSYRLEALRRIHQDVTPFETGAYAPRQRQLHALRIRFPFGPLVSRVNRDLVKTVETSRPDVVWFDKPTVFTPETMQALHAAGARIVFYVQDGPFGPRKDGCWSQFYRIYRMADLHCLVREIDVTRYRSWGLPFIKTMFSFDPAMQFAPSENWSDANRDREISFIGQPYEDRPAFLRALAEGHHLPVYINGNLWQEMIDRDPAPNIKVGGHLDAHQYRDGIWRSKVNLSFIARNNEDDIAHKSVEIAACGAFLLALRTPGHEALFEEDREAVFFSSVEECADKARFYLHRPDLREAIARRARMRAVRSGYDNDTQLTQILKRLDGED